MSILSFLFQQKKLALVFTISIVILGISVLSTIQRDRFPNVSLEQMYITTSYPSASPEDVELNVTNKIEKELKTVSGIERYTSISRDNYSRIHVEIEADASDKEAIKRDIRNAVNRVKGLPAEIKNLPTVMDLKPTHRSVIQINITDSQVSYSKLRKITEELEKQLEVIEGVSQVSKVGSLAKEVKIYLKPEKLIKHKLSLTQVLKSIDEHNVRYTAGDNNNIKEEKSITVLSKYVKANDVANIIVKSTFDGPVVKIKDIAKIVDGYAEETSIIRVNGYKSFILKIKKQENADVITVVDNIKSKVEEFKKDQVSTLNIFYNDDLSKKVKNRLGIVVNNGLIGLILVVIVLTMFLSFRTAFWVSLSLPVTLLGAVILLSMFGETINLISLAAMILVLGIVVDDSIIIAESIHHYIETEGASTASVVKGFKRVIIPVITTILTTVMAFSSMFMMTGTMGKFIYVMPMVVIFALIMSLLEVVFALPAHLNFKPKHREKSGMFERFQIKFKDFLTTALKFRYFIVLGFVVFLMLSLVLAATQMKFTLFPTVSAEKINAKIGLQVGISLKESEKIIKKIDEIIIKIVGNDLDSLSSDIASRYSHITYSEINLVSANVRELSVKDIIKNLRDSTKNIKGIKEIRFSISRPGPPQGEDVSFQLVSNNDEQRENAANKLEDILKNIKGVYNIDRDDKPGKKRVSVLLDNEQIQRLNIDYSSISRYLKASFNGVDATNMRQGEDDVYFRVYLGDENQSEDAIANIKIANKNNQLIAMKQFSSLKNIKGEPNYNHYNGQRSISISASVKDKDITSKEANSLALEQLKLSKNFPQVSAIIEGGAKDSDDSMTSFVNALLMALVGMFLLFTVLFNSYSQPLLILTAVPFGVIGVIWAFFVHNEPLSFFAILGFLALVGVVVNDSLVLVDNINRKRAETKDSDTNFNYIVEGTKARLRAVLLTSLTTLGGIMPLAYGLGGSDALLQPMAMSLGYGLLFATLMTLVLLPCMYMINIEAIAFLNKLFSKVKVQIHNRKN